MRPTARSPKRSLPSCGYLVLSARNSSTGELGLRPRGRALRELQVFLLADRELDAHRIEARDRREEGRLAAPHQISERYLAFADLPLHRREDRAVAEVELRVGEIGLREEDRGGARLDRRLLDQPRVHQHCILGFCVQPRDLVGRDRIVQVLLRHRLLGGERRQAVHVLCGFGVLGLRLVELGLCLAHRDLIRGELGLRLRPGEARGAGFHVRLVLAGVDFVEDLILLDGLSLFENPTFEEALDARADVDRRVGLGAPDVLAIDGNGRLGRLGDDDGGGGALGPAAPLSSFLWHAAGASAAAATRIQGMRTSLRYMLSRDPGTPRTGRGRPDDTRDGARRLGGLRE